MAFTKAEYVAQHFPDVEVGAVPCGAQILVQLRTVKKTTAGGIILAEETKGFNNGNTQVGRVVSLGQIAFCNRESGDRWKEGVWADVGDIVVMPKYGGFRFEVPIPDSTDKAIFCVFQDVEVKMNLKSNFESFDVLL